MIEDGKGRSSVATSVGLEGEVKLSRINFEVYSLVKV
jgi:hypothetical protein